MRTFTLLDEFTDRDSERSLIAAISVQQGLYCDLDGSVFHAVFAAEREPWETLELAIKAGHKIPVFPGWKPASDPRATLERLKDLSVRRAIARAVEEVAEQLYKVEEPASVALAQVEKSFGRVKNVPSEAGPERLIWASDLLPKVMHDAEERARLFQQTGRPVIGLSTGICKLDEVLNGLNAGLYLLAGGPGLGKTTLAQQIAGAVAREELVLFVTFENSPENLVLKAVASRAGLNTREIQSGTANLEALATAAVNWGCEVAGRLALLEGSSRLSVGHLRRLVAQQKGATRLVIVDYLQLWAKTAVAYRAFDTVRGRVEALAAELRELATEFGCPILAIASQNREQGAYGEGAGKANLDSLKESGDLEYIADVAMFLTGSKTRSATPPARALELYIRKNRHGDTGQVRLIFRPDVSKFREEAADVRT